MTTPSLKEIVKHTGNSDSDLLDSSTGVPFIIILYKGSFGEAWMEKVEPPASRLNSGREL